MLSAECRAFDILIVDDEPKNLSVLRQMLTQEGFTVRPAISGELALTAIEAKLPDLVLLDIMMPPGLDGYEVCRAIKNREASKDLPVIFLSALDDTMDKVRAFEVGGQDYISKPFQFEEVLARVRTHLRLRQMQRELALKNAELAAANEELERLARQDFLTGLANRRTLDEFLETEWRRLTRERAPLSVILMDIDFFKGYNDQYGHGQGDECLQQVAAAIDATVKRPADLAARYGGEEFCVVLPGTDGPGALAVAEDIRLAVAGLAIPHAASKVAGHVTISLGVAAAVPSPEGHPLPLVKQADEALYRSKDEGRNRSSLQQT